MRHIVYRVETEVETDGRWIAEIPDLPGVLAYGSTEKETVASAQALALRVLADREGGGYWNECPEKMDEQGGRFRDEIQKKEKK